MFDVTASKMSKKITNKFHQVKQNVSKLLLLHLIIMLGIGVNVVCVKKIQNKKRKIQKI